MVKAVYIGLGFVFLGLGFLGTFLPILPTTPFLLLASYFFVRGSERFDRWFRSTNIYKKYLESFLQDRSMTVKQKVSINVFADAMILIGFFAAEILWVRVFLILIILTKWYYFIFKIKTIRE